MSEEIPVLSNRNVDEVFAEYEDSIILPAVGKLSACRVLLVSAPVSRINAFQRANKTGNDKKIFAALCELIAVSVVGPEGEAVWNRDSIQKMAKANIKRFTELQYGVLQFNGLTKEKSDLEDAIEDEAKN